MQPALHKWCAACRRKLCITRHTIIAIILSSERFGNRTHVRAQTLFSFELTAESIVHCIPASPRLNCENNGWSCVLPVGNWIHYVVVVIVFIQEVEDECEHYVKLEAIGFGVGKRMILR